jgi:hypothetical protein
LSTDYPGVGGGVNALCAIGTDLYIGVTFLSANGVEGYNRICKYNTQNSSFSKLGTEFNNTVKAIYAIGNNLYIGSGFTTNIITSIAEIKHNDVSLGFMPNNSFETINSFTYNNKKYITFMGNKYIINI